MTVDEIEQQIKDIIFGKGWESTKFWQQRKNDTESFKVEWIAGGQGGGSCWDKDNSNLHPIDSEPEPEFVQLDEVLNALWPKIGYLQYKVLVQTLVTRGTREQNEYYGNYTSYASKSVNISDLAEYLAKHIS